MHIAIIGNGISGVTAARFARQWSDSKITLISAESDYFFSRTALMYIYMGHMRRVDTQPYENWFWEKNRIDLVNGRVQEIDFDRKKLIFDSSHPASAIFPYPSDLSYDKLILALGSKPNKFGWPGQDLQGVGGLYSLQDLDRMEANSAGLQRAVIVGGGLIGIEMAEMFHSRHIPVSFLVREESYWSQVLPPEESQMINRHILANGVDLRLGTELKEILDDGTGKAAAVLTVKEERIECGFVGLTAGVHPNIGFLKTSNLELNRGILVDKFLQTNIPDVYAIGDCAEIRSPKPGRRPIEAIWYTGRMMGEVVAHSICKAPLAYDPGIWFNSAKFFDIEYQVYGEMPANLPDDTDTLYWEHPNGDKAIRINYNKADKSVKGFNLMGIRYRHAVCEKWIAEKATIETVLTHLGMANFDPEFYKQYEGQLIEQYNQKTGASLRLKTRRGLKAVLDFLS